MKSAVEELWLQRLSKMPEEQQNILVKLYNKIFDCEGEGMPRKYWCGPCKATWARLHELFVRFELLNMQHNKQAYRRNASTHPGFFGYGDN